MKKLFVILAVSLYGSVALAEDEVTTVSAAISPTLGQTRSSLEENGISFNAVITSDTIAVLHGGIQTGVRNATNYDFITSVDTNKAGLWNGGKFRFYLLGDHGSNNSDITGQYQTASNIQAADSVKLFEAYYEHEFEDGPAILFGLHNYNSEFDVSQYGSLFLNSAFGIGTNISQVGPSIFPSTGLALRGKYQFNINDYIQAAAYDGVPGDPNDARGTHVKLDKSDGFFYALEGGRVSSTEQSIENYYKVAFGGWYKTTQTEDNAGNFSQDNYGVYAVGERSLFREEDKSQGLGTFIQLGWAPPTLNEFEEYYGFGLNYVGLITGRDLDTTGIAFNSARHGNAFLKENTDAARAESILELTHRIQLLPYLAIQADAQYVWDPAADPSAKNAVVFITRIVAQL